MEKNGPSKCIPALSSSSVNLRIDGFTIVESVLEGALGLNLFLTRAALYSFLSCAITDIVLVKLHFVLQKNFKKLGNDSSLSSIYGFTNIMFSSPSS